MIPNINLLPKSQRADAKSNLPYILLAIIATLALIFFVWKYFEARIALADLVIEEQTLLTERDKLQMDYDILMSQNKGSLEESVVFVEKVSYDVTPLIAETQNLLPENTYLTNYVFSTDTLELSIDFETMSDIATFVSRLENSPFFMDAQLGSVSNFVITPPDEQDEEVDEEEKFEEVPRYTTSIALQLNTAHLASVGGVQ